MAEPRNEPPLDHFVSPQLVGSPGRMACKRLLRNPSAVVAALAILLMIALALTAGFLSPYGYQEQLRGFEHTAPGGAYWFGTDYLGRDMLSRIMYGARISMMVGICATGVSLLLGVLVGLITGYMGGWVDAMFMRITDMVSAVPSLILAIAITALYEKPSLLILFLTLGLVGWTGIARVIRSQVLSVRTLDYVTAAQAMGATTRRIMFRHILPNCLSPIIVMATLAIGGNILLEAALSFLGLGVQDPFPSWGGMLNDARGYFQAYWWVAVFPGAAIVITVLAFNILGDGLRDALDPRAKK